MFRYFYYPVLFFCAMPVFAQRPGAMAATEAPGRVVSILRQDTGRTAESSAGRAGERQVGDPENVVEQTARINGRIANRVESRVRNRIDRSYKPQPNSSSPFRSAGEVAAQAGGI